MDFDLQSFLLFFFFEVANIYVSAIIYPFLEFESVIHFN